MTTGAALLSGLGELIPGERIITDAGERAIYSEDIAGPAGVIPLAVVRPTSPAEVSGLLGQCMRARVGVVTRGGGHSYTAGYSPTHGDYIVLDLGGLDQVLTIDRAAGWVHVQCGCTWATLYDALAEHGLRTPFFGPLSGFKATVGGALSQGSAFFGSAQHGFSDASVLGLEVGLASGEILRTGVGADGRPHPHPSGPNETGLFLGDCGAFGVKLTAVLKLIAAPAETGFASFAFSTMPDLLKAHRAVAACAGVSESFGFDPVAHQNLTRTGFDLLEGAQIAGDVLRSERSLGGRVAQMASLVRGGKRFVKDLQYSLHLCLDGDYPEQLAARVAAASEAALDGGGDPIPDIIPRVTRARPFRPIKALLGPDGERWLPVHGVLRMEDTGAAWAAVETVMAEHDAVLAKHEIRISHLTVQSGSALILEPQLFWPDGLSNFHRRHATASQVDTYRARENNPAAREAAFALRAALGDALRAAGAEHLQLGRYYPYLERLDPTRQRLLQGFKSAVDPLGIMNPGALFSR